MATQTDICNAAISHCGTRNKIASIDEGSAEANACRTHFALARDSLLRAFDWNFARLTASLGALLNPLATLGLQVRPAGRLPAAAPSERHASAATARDLLRGKGRQGTPPAPTST